MLLLIKIACAIFYWQTCNGALCHNATPLRWSDWSSIEIYTHPSSSKFCSAATSSLLQRFSQKQSQLSIFAELPTRALVIAYQHAKAVRLSPVYRSWPDKFWCPWTLSLNLWMLFKKIFKYLLRIYFRSITQIPYSTNLWKSLIWLINLYSM